MAYQKELSVNRLNHHNIIGLFDWRTDIDTYFSGPHVKLLRICPATCSGGLLLWLSVFLFLAENLTGYSKGPYRCLRKRINSSNSYSLSAAHILDSYHKRGEEDNNAWILAVGMTYDMLWFCTPSYVTSHWSYSYCLYRHGKFAKPPMSLRCSPMSPWRAEEFLLHYKTIIIMVVSREVGRLP